LLHGNSTNGEFSKPVESSRAGDPDSAFAILEKTQDDIAREAVRSCKYIGPALMYVYEPTLHSSDPEAAIVVPEDPIRIEIPAPEQFTRMGCASNRI
jgi:hypothetical protein